MDLQVSPIFEGVFRRLLDREGRRFTDDKQDSGGPTKYGVTQHVARANGYLGSMKDMPVEVARRIYWNQYWNLLNLETVWPNYNSSIAQESLPIAEELFDTAVNCGPGISGKFLQRALNVLNREERDYPDVRVDGLVGPLTGDAFHLFMKKRGSEGEQVLLRALNSQQGARYIEIAEARKKDEKYTFGWFLRRIK